MNFLEFKDKAIACLRNSPSQSAKQIAESLSPFINAGQASSWLKKLSDEGVFLRERDNSFSGVRFLYRLSSDAAIATPVPIDIDQTWNLVLTELPDLIRPLFKEYATPLRLGWVTYLNILPGNMSNVVMARENSCKAAIAKVFGLQPGDIKLGFTCTEDERATRLIREHWTANRVDTAIVPADDEPEILPQEIKGEFSVKADGTTTISIRGAARLLGISHQSLSKNLGGNLNGSNLAEALTRKGFNPATFGEKGIPDTAFSFMVTHYAFKAGRYCTTQAESLHDAFEAIGVRTWIQGQLGWTPPSQGSIVKSNSDLMAIADSMQALTVSIEQMGQIIQAQSQQIDLFKAFLSEQTTPPSTRSKIARLIGSVVSSGQSELCQAWAQFYQSVEIQCRINLELERRNLEMAGMASPKKLDAIESLGLSDVAFAIASELFVSAK